MNDLALNNPQPNAIVFSMPQNREVMRITAAGVVVANGVEVDEASAAVIAALSGYIRGMVADKDAEIERLRAALQHISNLSPTEPHAMQIKARAALAEEKK